MNPSRRKQKDIADQLKLEREIVLKGGYAKSERLPWKSLEYFRDSVTCINHAEVVRREPCTDCVLIDWVPEEGRTQDLPCHHIPLNERGETIASLSEGARTRSRVEQALLHWLDATIADLEKSGGPAAARRSRRD